MSIFIKPFKYIRKLFANTKLDNFLGGLIIGAIVSLLVNYLTFSFQDMLQKQRVLEALENEILSNTINANSLIAENNFRAQTDNSLNYFYTGQTYSKFIWDSPDVLSYIVQLPKNQQSALYKYYFFVQKVNELVNKTEMLRESNASKCTALLNANAIIPDNNYCIALDKELLREDNASANMIATQGIQLRQVFHPTKDRLNNFILRYFLGSDALTPLNS